MFYTLQLNAKLQPFDRHDLEDIIDEFLSKEDLGETSGGGTLMSKEGEIEYCDIEISLNECIREITTKVGRYWYSKRL